MPKTRPDFKWYTARTEGIKRLVEAAEEAYAEGGFEEVIDHLDLAAADALNLWRRIRDLITRLHAEEDEAEGGAE